MSLVYTAPTPCGPGESSKNHSLYIGGKTDAKSKRSLNKLGVTHILNVTPEKEACVQVRHTPFLARSFFHLCCSSSCLFYSDRALLTTHPCLFASPCANCSPTLICLLFSHDTFRSNSCHENELVRNKIHLASQKCSWFITPFPFLL